MRPPPKSYLSYYAITIVQHWWSSVIIQSIVRAIPYKTKLDHSSGRGVREGENSIRNSKLNRTSLLNCLNSLCGGPCVGHYTIVIIELVQQGLDVVGGQWECGGGGTITNEDNVPGAVVRRSGCPVCSVHGRRRHGMCGVGIVDGIKYVFRFILY